MFNTKGYTRDEYRGGYASRKEKQRQRYKVEQKIEEAGQLKPNQCEVCLLGKVEPGEWLCKGCNTDFLFLSLGI